MNAVLSCAKHPEYGQVTIPLPIPDDDYDHCIDLLQAMSAGDVKARDCRVDEIISGYPALKVLEGTTVNVDELDYLAKRLESFFGDDGAKFEACINDYGFTDIEELINLTFCCDQSTVITDFSDLDSLGKEHYITIHGGAAPSKEVEALDGEKVILDLIASGKGSLTPYGVLFRNDMEYEPLYTSGGIFPPYYYHPSVVDVEISPKPEPLNTTNTTLLQLPISDKQLQRAMERTGIRGMEYARMQFCQSTELPDSIDAAMDFENDSLSQINTLCRELAKLDENALLKLGGIVAYTHADNTMKVMNLLRNLGEFEFAPLVRNAKELGRYMICESERFEYDSNLESYYDFERYGQDKIEEMGGEFNEYGFVSYLGAMSLEELMTEEAVQEQSMTMEMGGM